VSIGLERGAVDQSATFPGGRLSTLLRSLQAEEEIGKRLDQPGGMRLIRNDEDRSRVIWSIEWVDGAPCGTS